MYVRKIFKIFVLFYWFFFTRKEEKFLILPIGGKLCIKYQKGGKYEFLKYLYFKKNLKNLPVVAGCPLSGGQDPIALAIQG